MIKSYGLSWKGAASAAADDAPFEEGVDVVGLHIFKDVVDVLVNNVDLDFVW